MIGVPIAAIALIIMAALVFAKGGVVGLIVLVLALAGMGAGAASGG